MNNPIICQKMFLRFELNGLDFKMSKVSTSSVVGTSIETHELADIIMMGWGKFSVYINDQIISKHNKTLKHIYGISLMVFH